jgi:hypothetical protein
VARFPAPPVRFAALLAALLVLLAPAPAPAALGTQRLLVVLATWGPQPFARDQVRRVVFEEADAFLRRSSHGQLRLEGEVTPWLRVLGETAVCPAGWLLPSVPRALAEPAQAAARAAGYSTGDYDGLVYLVPRTRCAFTGLGWDSEVLLHGALDTRLLVHELGHSWGLAHAGSAACQPYCSIDATGDPYSLMGAGVDDFSVFEKVALGWRPAVTTATRTRTLTLARADRAGPAPKALRVPTATGQYWLEYRPQPRARADRLTPLAPGVLFRQVNPAEAEPPLGPPPLLLPAHGSHGRPALARGQTFRAPGIFTAHVLALHTDQATLRFTWTDKQRPSRPKIIEVTRTASTTGRRLAIRWKAAQDQGSGIAHYLLSLDGQAPTKVLRQSARLQTTGHAQHTVSIVAVDRAGNRSKPTLRHLSST